MALDWDQTTTFRPIELFIVAVMRSGLACNVFMLHCVHKPYDQFSLAVAPPG